MNKRQSLTELLILKYFAEHNLDPSILYCKDCGKLLIYEDALIFILTRKGRKYEKGKLLGYGTTFLKVKNYNGHDYSLCRCKECVLKKFPEIENTKFLYASKAAKYTLYAYDVSDEDFYSYTKERQALTREKMIKNYGEEEGLKRWDIYCNKQAETNKFDYKHEKYGMTLQEFRDYNKSRACTLENFIKRHGEEEGKKRWKEYCDRQRFTTSKDYFILAYGKEEGLKKYDLFISQMQTSSSGKANRFFDELCKDKMFEGHEIYYDGLNKEFEVCGYRLDFYDKTSNVVVEFNGDIWHGNPDIYDSELVIEVPFGKPVKAREMWEKDKIRKDAIMKELGCGFAVVWEKDSDYDIKNEILKVKGIFA